MLFQTDKVQIKWKIWASECHPKWVSVRSSIYRPLHWYTPVPLDRTAPPPSRRITSCCCVNYNLSSTDSSVKTNQDIFMEKSFGLTVLHNGNFLVPSRSDRLPNSCHSSRVKANGGAVNVIKVRTNKSNPKSFTFKEPRNKKISVSERFVLFVKILRFYLYFLKKSTGHGMTKTLICVDVLRFNLTTFYRKSSDPKLKV